MEKVCNRCGKSLPIKLFNKHPNTADKRQNQCRPCRNQVQREYRNKKNGNEKTLVYEKTEKGFLMRLYRNMKSRITGIQKAKFHLYEGKELLPKDEFYNWALGNKDFKRLFKNYKNNNYDRKLAPSVDRKKSEIGYTISNMQFVTHSQNSAKSSIQRKINNGKVL